jgi:hypothetical protein
MKYKDVGPGRDGLSVVKMKVGFGARSKEESGGDN